MKNIVSALGRTLVAAVAFILVLAVCNSTVIPVLRDYVKSSFPDSKNLEISSSISVDPDSAHGTPAHAETYTSDDYIYTYDSSEAGWSVAVKDKTQTRYEPICETIYGRPVISVNGTFEDCTELIIAPAIPTGVVDVRNAFKGCTALGGIVTIYATPTSFDGCFSGTVCEIVLGGSGEANDVLVGTATNGNVTVA